MEAPLEGATVPGFGPPRTPPGPRTDPPLDPEVTTITEGPAGGMPEGELAGERIPRMETTGSSPGSTDPLGIVTGDPAAFEPLADLFVDLAALAAHSRLAPGNNDLWMADEQDHEMIAAPLARIAARHAPIAAGPMGDVADGLQAVVGIAGYTMKNIKRRAELEQWLQQQSQNAGQEQPA